MNIQRIDSLIKAVQAYTTLDTKTFEDFCQTYLRLRKRRTFDLKVQNGLMTLIELHADIATLSAFLLCHLPVEARKSFRLDEVVLELLIGLDNLREITALDQLQNPSQSMESARKMFLAMAKDLRVILVLMALRYAELFELDQLSPDLRKKVARQTLEIFVPLTGRLGIYTLKRKLEDRCFSFLSPAEYDALQSAFDQRVELSESTIQALVQKLTAFLEEHHLHAQVAGRVKGRYSTYTKLKEKGGGSIDDIYDLLALRVVVDKQTDCYTVLSLVNNHWQPIHGRFKDYIAMPKINGYRSLHTALLGMISQHARPVEIQIRTYEMHREAEFGIAAHWWYEEESIKRGASQQQFVGKDTYAEKLQWMTNLVQLQDSMAAHQSKDRLDFFSDRIFVMTLNGVVLELPKGSTPLDFAYALSESLGHHCAKAKVNGKVVPLNHELKNGDRVFIVKKMNVSPNIYWLSFVRTDRAKKAIRQWFLELGDDSILEQGVRLLNRLLQESEHPLLDKEFSLLKHYDGRDLSLAQRRDLLISIGQGEINPSDVLRGALSKEKLVELSSLPKAALPLKEGDIFVAGEPGFKTKKAACCSPVNGNDIVGYVTRGGFISIHERSCKVLASLDHRRFIDAWWAGQQRLAQEITIDVTVSVANLLVKLAPLLQKKGMILEGFHHRKHERGYVLSFSLRANQAHDVEDIVRNWQKVPGVIEVREAG